MARLNNGKPLTGYELVRIRAKDLAGIQRMARHPFFDLILSPIMINGRKNEDAVIKMYILLCTSSFSFDKRNIEKVYQTLDVTHEVHDAVTFVLDFMLRTHNYLIEHEGRKADRKFTTRTHLISLAPVFQKALEENHSTADMAGFIKIFFTGAPTCSRDYNLASIDGTGSAASVRKRTSAAMAAYKNYFKGPLKAPITDPDDMEDSL